MSEYNFQNGASISYEEINHMCNNYRCDCDHETLQGLTITVEGSKCIDTVDVDGEDIDKLQKFLLRLWYVLEKKKNED